MDDELDYKNSDINRFTDLCASLKNINGICFTRREIDVIACILGGRSSKKTATILSIHHKTVANHIHNIMSKIRCNSRENIIDFIEKSGKFGLIKTHYLNLSIQTTFDNELKKIAALPNRKDLSCLIFYHKGSENGKFITTQLKHYLQIIGVKTCIEVTDSHEENLIIPTMQANFLHIIYILPQTISKSLLSDPLSLRNKITQYMKTTQYNFITFLLFNEQSDVIHPKEILICNSIQLEQKNYYLLFFQLLKRIYPKTNFDKYILEFNKQYSTLLDPAFSEVSIEQPNTLAHTELHNPSFFTNKKKWVSIWFGIFLIIGCLWLGLKNLQYSANNCLQWNIPRQDNAFIGRRNTLKTIHHALTPKTNHLEGMAVPEMCVCPGLGGVGKTQMALQYVHHTSHHYTLKAWFSGLSSELLRQQYITFAQKLGYSEEKVAIDAAILYVNQWLAAHPGALLIFDDVSSYEEIAPFLPEKSNTSILITTRNQLWPKKFQQIPVDIMTKDEAFQLVKTLSKSNDSNIKIIIEKLGYLPLALAQASAYIAHNNISITEYLKLYQIYQQDLLSDPTLPKGTNHDPIALTWNVSLEALEKNSKNLNVKKLVRIFLTASSYFSSEDIPISVLKNWLERAYPEIEKTELLIYQLLSELQDYSLLTINAEKRTFSLHPLVQAVMRNRHQALTVDNQFYPLLTPNWYNLLCDVVNAEFNLKTGIIQDEVKQQNLLPHLQSLANNYSSLLTNMQLALKPPQALGTTFFNIGNIFLRIGAYQLARPYYEQALKIQEQNTKKNTIEVASTLTNLGNACRALGGGKQAEIFLEGALEIFEKHYGKDHPQTISTLTNLGCAYGTLGKDKQAKNILMRALSIAERNSNSNDLQLAEILTKLGDISSSLGDAKRSKEYLEKALQISEQYYGKNHRECALIMTLLGAAFGYLEEPKPAIELLEKALQIQQEYYGPEHRYIAVTSLYLGKAYILLGKNSKAKEFLEVALDFFRKTPGHNYYLSITLTDLGKVHANLNDITKANEYLDNALNIEDEFFKAPHPTTAITLLMKANLHIYLKEFDKALPLATRSHQILLETYGKEHTYTNQSLEAIAKCTR